MKHINFHLAMIAIIAFSVLSDLNTSSPTAGFMFATIVAAIAYVAALGLGLTKSLLVEESGWIVSGMLGITVLVVILAPSLFFPGWYGVGFSLSLMIFWNIIKERD